jgi:hypothetical protein
VAQGARAFDMTVLAIRRDATQPDPHGLAVMRGPDALDDVLARAIRPAPAPPFLRAMRSRSCPTCS